MDKGNTPKDFATYHVGLKALLRKEEKFLILRLPEGLLDLPGGRIDTVEHETPLFSVLDREVKEEIGTHVEYTLGNFAFAFRRYVPSADFRIFTLVYEAQYLSGDITLSHEHLSYQWLTKAELENINVRDFCNEGEFEAFREYLSSLEN